MEQSCCSRRVRVRPGAALRRIAALWVIVSVAPPLRSGWTEAAAAGGPALAEESQRGMNRPAVDGESAADSRQATRAARRSPIVEVFEQRRDAVVNIASVEEIVVRSRSPFDGLLEDLFDVMPRQPRTRSYKRGSVGSGFIVHPAGYIVTNAHVVARGAEHRVTLSNGLELDAQIIASDPRRDLAILKIEADDPLPTLPLGRSDDLMIGEAVVAIGNPLGYAHTVTAGVVSAVDREISVSPEVAFTGLIQTDASINPGNSGGPLLNILGELIGINTAIRGDAQNIGFAIPVDQLREVLPHLIDVERRYGIVTGIEVDVLRRPRVVSVQPDGPGARAGIRAGDVLLAIDGQEVREGIDFHIALIRRTPGDRLRLRVGRDGSPVDVEFPLAARVRPDAVKLAHERLGIAVLPLSEEFARQLGLRRAAGIYVAEVLPGSAAEDAGLIRRDILLALGDFHVTTAAELAEILDRAGPGATLQVRVLRIERGMKVQRTGPITLR